MTTLNQLIRKTTIRKKKLHRKRTTALQGNPQRKAICTAINREKPKKPNSALRKVLKVFCLIYETKSLNKGEKKKKKVIVKNPRSVHNPLTVKSPLSLARDIRVNTLLNGPRSKRSNLALQPKRSNLAQQPAGYSRYKKSISTNGKSRSQASLPITMENSSNERGNISPKGKIPRKRSSRLINKKKRKKSSKKIKYKIGIKKKARIHAPGEMPLNHFAKFQRLLMRGCRVRDLPGVRYRVILGKLDIKAYYGPIVRKRKRSKYSLKRTK